MIFFRRLARRESGGGTLEFALVVPVLILVLLVGFDFTRALLAYTTINSGSREGARYAVLHTGDRIADIERAVEARTRPLSASNLSVKVEWKYSDAAIFASCANPGERFDDCLPPPNRPPRDVTVRVSVEYPWSAASAISATFLTAIQPGVLVSTSLMDMRR